LGVGDPMGVVGTRERWRVRLDSVPPEVLLGGWIRLSWGPPEIGVVKPKAGVKALFENLGLRVERHDTAGLSRMMELFTLPMINVRRPKDLDGLAQVADQLCHYLSEKCPPTGQ